MEKPRRGETAPSPYRSKRLYCINGLWYFDTREGEQYGPFKDEYEARAEDVEILGSVPPGDRVVVRGNERLQPGQEVSIMDS